MDPNQPNQQQQSAAAANANEVNAKRQALTGQWRTPPLPVFAGQQQQQQQQQQQAMPPPPNLPESTDDYAKALHEAYLRGAEAAAALQAQQQQTPADFAPPEFDQTMPNAVSCPNFHQLQPPLAPTLSFEEPLPEPPAAVRPMVPSGPALYASAPVPHQAPSAPPPPPHAVHHAVPHQQQPQPPPPPRSFSLPDMASYAVRAQAEEEKRKKRLARNRASARLRRLRKKNLVDSYEGEVGVLEQSLQKLRAHEWGSLNAQEDSTSALLEALGMERGQQVLEDNAQRTALLKELWQQQRDQVQYVRDCQLEQQVLQALVVPDSNPGDDAGLLQELDGVLQLTPEQRQSLHHATQGLDEDVQAMETIDACLKAMQDQDWLLQNEGVTEITNQFMSILNPNQVSKFLLWTDANAEAMEQLDFIHASNGPVAHSPMFSFGMDDYYPGATSGSSGSLSALMQVGDDE